MMRYSGFPISSTYVICLRMLTSITLPFMYLRANIRNGNDDNCNEDSEAFDTEIVDRQVGLQLRDEQEVRNLCC